MLMVSVCEFICAMGNYVVTPPFNDWYVQPLKKLGVQVQDHMNSGTLFMIFQGLMADGTEVLIKAYQYQDKLAKYQIVTDSQLYFRLLNDHHKETAQVVKYKIASVQDNMAFLIRPKFERTLVDVAMFQQPHLQLPEKRWIFFQLVTALIRLHATGLAHGDIKPSNIFIQRDLSVFIGDPAPFKPAKISPSRTHLFYHFFTTDSTSGCYIAPERISGDEDGTVDLQAADWWSLGCVVYYLLTDGRHLFDLMKVKDYIAGNFDLDKELLVIENEKLRQLVKGLLEVDILKRRKTSYELLPYCPKFFDQLHDIYGRFQVMRDDGVFEFQSCFIHLKGIVEDQDPEYRCIVFNYLESAVKDIKMLSDYKYAIDQITELLRPCTDYFKLTRGIPFIMGFIDLESTSVVRSCVFAILELIKTVSEIPEQIEGYFEYYLKVELHASCTSSTDTSSALAFAEVLPLIVSEMERLEPKSMTSFAVAFASIFTAQNIEVFRVFAKSLKSVVSGGHSVLNAFFYFILAALNYEEEFKEEILSILETFYANASETDIPLYKTQIRNSVLPICKDLCTRNPTEQLEIAVFRLIELLMRVNLIEKENAYDLVSIVNSCTFSELDEMRYIVSKLLAQFPEPARQSNDWYFIFEHQTQSPRRTAVSGLTKLKSTTESSEIADATLLKCSLFPQSDYSPKFLCSYHPSSSPIDFIINPGLSNLFVTIDRSRRMRWMRLPSSKELLPVECQSHMIREQASAACVSGERRLVIGYSNGAMDSFDFQTTRKTRIFAPRDNKGVTAVQQLEPDVLLSGCSDGTIYMCDIREGHRQLRGKKIDVSPITDICKWGTCNALAGVACSDGVLALVDTRMFIPILVVDTIPCKKVVPLATEGDKIAYLAMGEKNSVIAIEPRLETNVVYREQHSFRWAEAYHGGAVVIDDRSASLVNCTNSIPNLRLFDGGSREIVIEAYGESLMLDSPDVCVDESIHKHSGTITCGTHLDDVFVTGDNTGFVHVWRLKKNIRQMSS